MDLDALVLEGLLGSAIKTEQMSTERMNSSETLGLWLAQVICMRRWGRRGYRPKCHREQWASPPGYRKQHQQQIPTPLLEGWEEELVPPRCRQTFRCLGLITTGPD